MNIRDISDREIDVALNEFERLADAGMLDRGQMRQVLQAAYKMRELMGLLDPFSAMTYDEKLNEIERVVFGPNAGLDEPDGGQPTDAEMLKNVQDRVRNILRRPRAWTSAPEGPFERFASRLGRWLEDRRA